MSGNSIKGIRIILVLAAVVCVAAAGYLIFGGKSDDDDRVKIAEKVKNDIVKSEKLKQLKTVLANKRKQKNTPPLPINGKLVKNEPGSAEELTLTEKAALKKALTSIYNPSEILEALDGDNGVEFTRQLVDGFAKLQQAETLDVGDGQIPVTPSMKLVINRLGAVRSYAMHLMHSNLPPGQEEKQWELVNKANENFEARFSTIADEHSFLDLRMVEPPK